MNWRRWMAQWIGFRPGRVPARGWRSPRRPSPSGPAFRDEWRRLRGETSAPVSAVDTYVWELQCAAPPRGRVPGEARSSDPSATDLWALIPDPQGADGSPAHAFEAVIESPDSGTTGDDEAGA